MQKREGTEAYGICRGWDASGRKGELTAWKFGTTSHEVLGSEFLRIQDQIRGSKTFFFLNSPTTRGSEDFFFARQLEREVPATCKRSIILWHFILNFIRASVNFFFFFVISAQP